MIVVINADYIQMLQSYLKISFRNILKNKNYSLINLLGLTIGLSGSFILFLFISHELSFDKFHPDYDNLYKVVDEYTYSGKSTKTSEIAAPTGPEMNEIFPEVRNFVRLRKEDAIISFSSDQILKTEFLLFSDSTFFELFSFKLLDGDTNVALKEPYSLVITKSVADRLGTKNIIGKAVKSDLNGQDFTITGIVDDPPDNSHIKFDMLASFSTLKDLYPNAYENWLAYGTHTYVKLAENSDIDELNLKLSELVEKHIGSELARHYDHHLVPITSIHLGEKRVGDLQLGGTWVQVYSFSLIALLLLFISGFNFVNLSIAQSVDYGKEVGIRKVIGANSIQLRIRFLSDSVILSCISIILATLIIGTVLPYFNLFTGKNLSVNILENPFPVISLILIGLITGVLSGVYPAFVLANLNPIKSLKGTLKLTRGIKLRQFLVVAQFTITISLIFAALIIWRQLKFFNDKPLGFDKEQLIVIDINSKILIDKRDVIKEELLGIPGVLSVANSSGLPGTWIDYGPYRLEGEGQQENRILNSISIDFDFIKTLKLEVIGGRGFSIDVDSDSNSYILNESAARHLGFENPSSAVGNLLIQGLPTPEISVGNIGYIVGVIKDFHFASLHHKIDPLVLEIDPDGFEYYSVKVNSSDLPGLINSIGKIWINFEPEYPFKYTFLDQEFSKLYFSQEKTGKMVNIFTLLAIIVSVLGLFGLASFVTQKRTKELAIRKICGAESFQLFILINTEFFTLIGIAFILGVPFSTVLVQKWLNQFAYRITINLNTILATGILVYLVLLIAILYHSLKSIKSNPINSLRYE